MSAGGLWINRQTTFCDIRVFNPLARCHLHHSLPAVHKKNENKKKRECNQRILQVEHGSFTPLVFLCFGGMSRECSCFISHTAEHLPNRRKWPESKISAWIKARLNFALVRSMLLCLHGTRTPSNIALCAIVAESNIEWITYRFVSCYFMIINVYGYIFIRFLFRYFCVYTLSSDAVGLIFHLKLTVCFISNIYAGFILLKKWAQVLKIKCAIFLRKKNMFHKEHRRRANNYRQPKKVVGLHVLHFTFVNREKW